MPGPFYSSQSIEAQLGWFSLLDYGLRADGTDDATPATNALGMLAGLTAFLPGTDGRGNAVSINLGSNVTVPANTLLVLLPGLTITGAGVFTTTSGAILDLRSGAMVFSGVPILGRIIGQVPILGSTLTALADSNATITAAQLLGGFLEAPVTAARTYTLDTAAHLDSAVLGAAAGDSFECQLANTSGGAFAVTIGAGTGITLKGSTTTVGQNKMATLSFRKTGSGAWTVYVQVSA